MLYHEVLVHSPTHLDEKMHNVGFLETSGDVEILEVRQLPGEPVNVRRCPFGDVVVILKGCLDINQKVTK